MQEHVHESVMEHWSMSGPMGHFSSPKLHRLPFDMLRFSVISPRVAGISLEKKIDSRWEWR